MIEYGLLRESDLPSLLELYQQLNADVVFAIFAFLPAKMVNEVRIETTDSCLCICLAYVDPIIHTTRDQSNPIDTLDFPVPYLFAFFFETGKCRQGTCHHRRHSNRYHKPSSNYTHTPSRCSICLPR